MLLLLLSLLSGTAANAQTINLWTRAPGSYVDGNVPKPVHEKTLDLDSQTFAVERRFDFQYNQSRLYRGVSLASIVDAYAWADQSDLLLLHFDNGMVLPLPLDDGRATLTRLDPFVAYDFREPVEKRWSHTFPSIVSYDEMNRPSRPIAFASNKLVVATGELPAATSKEFSPWRHVTSLTGLEFVRHDAYYRQFQVRGIAALDPGLQAFEERCQFCHSLNGVGATFGWDFLSPVPIYELKRADHLFNKVKYSYHDALRRGLMMPAQPDVREEEMTALWRWLKATGSGRQPPYRP